LNLTLLVENNPKIASFYRLNLSTWLGLETVTQKSAELALGFLAENTKNVTLIIVRSKIGKESTAQSLIDYLKLNKLSIPVIIVGPGAFVGSTHVANSLDLKDLIKTAASALKITAKEMSEKVVPDYFSIPISFLKNIIRPVCPVFIKDPKNTDGYKLEFNKLEDIDQNTVDELIKNKVVEIFVNKMERLAFVSNITAELMSHLEANELSEDELISAVDKSIELLSTKLLTIGLTPETIELAKKNMAIVQTTARRNNKLSKLLDKLLNNQASYLYRHTQILTHIGLHIIHNLDWGNADQEEKICFIAFFHDIALESDIQCKIKSTQELKKSKLTDEEKSLVERHAQIAAEYVTNFPHSPMGADQIIRQHHGQLNGLGFSEHYGANMSPMSMVFIVAEEFTRIIMKYEPAALNREEMLRELREEFTTNRFLKIVEKLESITL
jgi:HD-GYP domain-containing protein (c-di-GMP phosphodiesterase class II)